MQVKRVARSRVIWSRRMPREEFRCRKRVQRGLRQRRQMQSLADVASRVRPRVVQVEKGPASREIQQRHARDQRCSAPRTSHENGAARMHNLERHLSVPA